MDRLVEAESSAGLRITLRDGARVSRLEFGPDGFRFVRDGREVGRTALAGGRRQIALVYAHGLQTFRVLVDGDPLLVLAGAMETDRIELSSESPVSCRNLWIYRSVLRAGDLDVLRRGGLIRASLDLYATLSESLDNKAQSLNALVAGDDPAAERAAALKSIREKAEAARREAPVFKEKTARPYDPAVIPGLVGRYVSAAGEEVDISFREGKLIVKALGQEGVLLSESPLKYFLRYPAEITVEFQPGEGSLVLNVMGRRIPAARKPSFAAAGSGPKRNGA
jgi:hypothetical protein